MVFIPSRETFSLSQDRLPFESFSQFYRLLCERLGEQLASRLETRSIQDQPTKQQSRRPQSARPSARSSRRKVQLTSPAMRWLSLALPLPDIDPLMALEQLGGLEQQHFYWEQPSVGLAIAAADPCVSVQFHGAERFRRSQTFLENCIAATEVLPPFGPEPDLPLCGPRFFCSFTFFDIASDESRFPPATLFLPRWQVVRLNRPSGSPSPGRSHAHKRHSQGKSGCSFVGHVTLQRGLPAKDDCLKIWQEYQLLLTHHAQASPAQPYSASGYSTSNSTPPIKPQSSSFPGLSGHRTSAQETPNRGFVDFQSPEAQKFQASAEAVLQAIERGDLHKAVLARPQRVQFKQPISAIAALQVLRQRYPDCHLFSVGAGVQASREVPSIFVGASPERLLQVQDRQLQTEAIAGSAPRGETPEQDRAIAHELQNNPKERHEHHLVSRFIAETLQQLGLFPKYSTEPQVLKLQGIQHLQTPIQCALPETIHPLEVLAQLHPTPAVAGVPQPLACAQIQQLESFERSLYAAPIGWIDGQGNCDFCVGIRSALIEGDRAYLFAGAGIVKGSKPEQELKEVTLKLQTLFSVLTSVSNQ